MSLSFFINYYALCIMGISTVQPFIIVSNLAANAQHSSNQACTAYHMKGLQILICIVMGLLCSIRGPSFQTVDRICRPLFDQ
jgi:hypothetical protein